MKISKINSFIILILNIFQNMERKIYLATITIAECYSLVLELFFYFFQTKQKIIFILFEEI